MLARLFCLAMLCATLLASSGCCNCRGWHGRHWCDSSCGECYWSEWFNDPPACCDPCDCYGNYAGPRQHPVMHAGYVGPMPTLASPEVIETEVPTPAVPREQDTPAASEPQPLPVPTETELTPPAEGEELIETTPLDATTEEMPSGEIPAVEE